MDNCNSASLTLTVVLFGESIQGLISFIWVMLRVFLKHDILLCIHEIISERGSTNES